jgi:hypothetical protein
MKEIGLKLAVKVVMDVLATTGIYPASTAEWDSKTNKIVNEKPRTEWQNGWNACQWDIFSKINDSLGKLEQEVMTDELAILLIADVGWMDEGKFILNMNDTFHYAADCEEVPEEEIKEVGRLFATYGYKGIDYWVAEKRGYDPEIPRNKPDVEEVRRKEMVRSKKLQEG